MKVLKEDKDLLVSDFTAIITQASKNLYREYWRFITRTNRKPSVLNEKSTIWDAYLKWHEYHLEKSDKEDFVGIEQTLFAEYRGQQKKQVPITASEIDLFKNYTELYANYRGTYWDMRLSNKIIHKIKNMKQEQIHQTLDYIFSLQLGFMTDAQIIDTGPILYLAGFSQKIKGNQSIIFAIVPERIPIIQQHKDSMTVIGFQYRQYLRIIDIVNDVKNQNQSYENFLYFIQSDPDKWNAFVPGAFFESGQKNNFQNNRELLDISNIVSFEQYGSGVRYMSALSQKIYIQSLESKAYQFVNGRWVSEFESSKYSYQIVSNMKNMNKKIIDRCTSQESCEWLLQFLQKIPNFKLRLTPEEMLLVSTTGNILCLGRSGTGKTTSAVLRLFALEILFKVRSTLMLNNSEGKLQDSRFTSEDAESVCGLHSVIVTASPVLTNEIRRFYTNLRNKIILELQKREKAKKLKKQQESQNKGQQEELKNEEDKIEDKHHEQEQQQDVEINDDEILDAEETEKNLQMPHSMSDMRDDNFPAFLTIKRLVYMIDASLKRPFFARNLKNEIIGLDSQAEWHNEQKGILMINNYYKSDKNFIDAKRDDIDQFMDMSSSDDEEEEIEDGAFEQIEEVREQIIKSTKRKKKVIEGEKVIQEFAQEVDFEYFEKKFWPKIGYKERSLTPASVWTEIYSTIKGSHRSSQFPTKYIPEEQYVGLSQKNTFINQKDRQKIYLIFLQYENWKKQIKGFDFMDLVNHILREIQGYQYFGVPIHFMLVDEVQDLTAATITLLLKVTEANIYMAGDTAQTIAKGVGFRFCDLKQMLNINDFDVPKVLQLTTNFRSHNQILHLANSIISAIELLFPLTIDKLHKEKSDINGLKPIILDSNLLESLFYILLGKDLNQDDKGILDKSDQNDKSEFGCDQVIIVRDQESKKKVPSVLQHALCLTVYEAKGLEFEDVVLFNFFNDSQVQDQWKLLNFLSVEKIQESKKENKLQELDDLDFEIVKEEEKQQEQSKEYVYTDRFYINNHKLDVVNIAQEYNALCTELKQLYVCITRPKKRLIIYDENQEGRSTIMKFWEKVNAVDVITEEMIQFNKLKSENITEEQKQLFSKLREGFNNDQNNDSFSQEEKRKGWKLQGIKMFKRRFYEQAIKCFEHSQDEELKQRALAYNLADHAAKCQSQSEALNYRLTDMQATIAKQKRRQMKQEIEQLKEQSINLFQQSSEVFQQIGLQKQAAQCLFTSGQYEKAAKLFEKIQFYSQAGESYFLLGDYSRAAMLYNEGKMVSKAVDCYKKLQNWDAILNCIKTNEKEFTQEQREQLILKYVPLALNSLYSILVHDNLIDNDEIEEEKD